MSGVSFPVDVIRLIFNQLPANVYFRLAHSLNRRLRYYAFDDVIILHVSFSQKYIRNIHRFYYKRTFTLANLEIYYNNPRILFTNFHKGRSIYIFCMNTGERVTVAEFSSMFHRQNRKKHEPRVITYWMSPDQKIIRSEKDQPGNNYCFSHLIIDGTNKKSEQ